MTTATPVAAAGGLTAASGVPDRRFWLSPAETAVLLLGAAGAWVATLVIATGMTAVPGTMGLDLAAFLGVWTLMMAAMMLPSIAPLTSLYSRTFADHRARRLAMLTVGYLTVWAAAGLVAFPLAAGADRLAHRAPGWAEAIAIGSCIACGVYQLTPLKERCLRHCRSPLGYLMRYTSWRGPLVDGRVGVEHGAWCLACCWSLMVLLVTFGVMNLVAMIGLAAVILTEKVLVPGRWFSIAVGFAAVGLAIAIGIHPALAAGLHAAPAMSGM